MAKYMMYYYCCEKCNRSYSRRSSAVFKPCVCGFSEISPYYTHDLGKFDPEIKAQKLETLRVKRESRGR